MNMNSRLLLTFFNPKVQTQFLYSAPSDGGQSVAVLSFPSHGHGLGVSDSANGLVCFYDGDVVFICNPSSGQLMTLPPTTMPMDSVSHFEYKVGCTIGYDASCEVHKVVRACTFTARVPLENCLEEGQIVEVLTLGGDAWRTITLPEEVRLMVDQDCGCIVDGVVHYKGLRRNGGEEDEVIVALDLKDEKWRVFGAISTGASLEEIDGKLGVVGAYDEFGLSLVRVYEEDGEGVLKMKETRVVKKEAWFQGRRSCRERGWGSMQQDGSCTATVSLADGREVVLTGQLHGLNDNGTFLNYLHIN